MGHPRTHLASWAGILQADAYGGYGGLYASGRMPAPVLEAVQRIDALFDIERVINGKDAAERLAVRRDLSAPLMTELHAWLTTQLARLSRNHDLAKAINYMLRRWDAFTRFLDDGRACLTNNAAERASRCVPLGRKAWLFLRLRSRRPAGCRPIHADPDRPPQRRRSSGLARGCARSDRGASDPPT